jgi:hypothetical protein
MFAFTRQDKKGQIEAVYCGRFSFVKGLKREAADNAVNILASSKSNLDQVNKNIAEEFIHSNQFLQSLTGLALNGFRWFVRLMWCTKKNKTFVINYYKIRAIYYLYAYEEFEKNAVTLLENNSLKRRLPLLLDVKILKSWLKSKTGFAKICLYLFFPFFIGMGWITTRHFTLITQQLEKDDDNWIMREKNHSIGGYVNRIGSMKKKNFLHNLLGKLKIEKWFPLSSEDDWRWMICKFYAENAIWKEYQKKINQVNIGMMKNSKSFCDYVLSIINFSANWSMLDDPLIFRLIKVCSSPHLGSMPQDIGWDMNNQHMRKTVNYFYLHGN